MNWKVKAVIQNAIALLPEAVSYEVYYRIQRRFGGLKKTDPTARLKAGIETWELIRNAGFDPRDKIFLEVGTGRAPLMPLAYWLMGAGKVITIDVNPYLKQELVREHVRYISENRTRIQVLFGKLLMPDRLEALIRLHEGPFSLKAFCALCRIEYRAPGDAGETALPAGSVDFHTSYTVFEHIPPLVLRAIIQEGNRVTKNKGLFVHKIDYSDHFAHADASIGKINFLRYSDARWKRYAGNRYMFMNRLRHDDFLAMLQREGHHIVFDEPHRDPHVFDMISAGTIHLDERFRGKSADTLAIMDAWVVSCHQG